MKFQTGPQGWSYGSMLYPAGAIITNERCVPPIDACALDFDAALTAWVTYKHCRHRLQRKLSAYDTEMFDRIRRDPDLLAYWNGKAKVSVAPTTPKFDLATALDVAIKLEEEKATNANRF